MKETNSLEMQLHSWELRRPSAGLKRHLFHPRPRQQAAVPMLAIALRWLAPAAACVLLALAVFTRPGGLQSAATPPESMIAVLASNQSGMTSLSNEVEGAGGGFIATNFEWTNRSGSTSSMSSFLPGKGN